MRKGLVVSIMLLVFALATTTLSSEIKPAIYVGGGMSMPLSPDFFKDYWKMGFGGGGGVGFAFSPVVEVGANFAYSSFALDEDKFLAAAGLTSEIMDLYNISVDISGFDMSAMEFLAYLIGVATSLVGGLIFLSGREVKPSEVESIESEV